MEPDGHRRRSQLRVSCHQCRHMMVNQCHLKVTCHQGKTMGWCWSRRGARHQRAPQAAEGDVPPVQAYVVRLEPPSRKMATGTAGG